MVMRLLTGALSRLLGRAPRDVPAASAGSGLRDPDAGLVRRILQSIHGNSLLLVGERDTASLLIRLATEMIRLPEEHPVFFPVYFDLRGTSASELFDELSERILTQLGAAPRGEPRAPSDDGLGGLVRTLKAVLGHLATSSGRRPRIVLLLDNADRLNELDPRVSQRLRSLFMRDLGDGLAAILAARHIDRHWDREGSPWFNFLEEIEV
jgi:hypothetical protein